MCERPVCEKLCLCVKGVCERLMCEKLCEEAADEAETARGRDKEPKTRTPHKNGRNKTNSGSVD